MKNFLIIISFILINCLSALSQSGENAGYTSLEPYDFHLQYLRNDTAMLVDVREHFEFKGKRIHGAVNIPSSGNLDYAADTIERNVALFIYCTTDYRSIRAAKFFSEKGYRKVYFLEGGIVRWKKEGYPVEKRRRKKVH